MQIDDKLATTDAEIAKEDSLNAAKLESISEQIAQELHCCCCTKN